MAGRKRDDAPDVERLTQTETARRLGMTRQAIAQWLERDDAPVDVEPDGTRVVLWPAFARWREDHLVEAEARRLVGLSSLDAERTRKTRAEADLAELERDKARAELVAVADFERALSTILQRLTARARALPARLAGHGPDVELDVEREVEAMVDELNQWDDDVVDVPPDPKDNNA